MLARQIEVGLHYPQHYDKNTIYITLFGEPISALARSNKSFLYIPIKRETTGKLVELESTDANPCESFFLARNDDTNFGAPYSFRLFLDNLKRVNNAEIVATSDIFKQGLVYKALAEKSNDFPSVHKVRDLTKKLIDIGDIGWTEK